MFDIQAFQEAIVLGNYFWKKHVLQRMAERGIKQNAVTETLLYGKIIKEYDDDRPFRVRCFCTLLMGCRYTQLHLLTKLKK